MDFTCLLKLDKWVFCEISFLAGELLAFSREFTVPGKVNLLDVEFLAELGCDKLAVIFWDEFLFTDGVP